jgi:sulfane dehydrogenase subunit SoxC
MPAPRIRRGRARFERRRHALIVFEGDRCDAFVKDLPLDRAAADVLIAYEMNGSPLRPENGYPARLVVPGYYGTNSVKWLTRLTLADARAAGPFTTR